MGSDGLASWLLGSRWPRCGLGPALVELESVHTGNPPCATGKHRDIAHRLVISVPGESLAAATFLISAGHDLRKGVG